MFLGNGGVMQNSIAIVGKADVLNLRLCIPCLPIIRDSEIFQDYFNINPTLKISPSWLVKILQEIELSGNFTGILETNDLQDIAEDDDMIVFEKIC